MLPAVIRTSASAHKPREGQTGARIQSQSASLRLRPTGLRGVCLSPKRSVCLSSMVASRAHELLAASCSSTRLPALH